MRPHHRHVVHDLRFPTSDLLDGSDAMNPDPDYSAAYVVLTTDDPALTGHGMTFTIGRGNEVCCAAIEAMRARRRARPRRARSRSRRVLALDRRRQPAAVARPREGRHAPGHRGRRQRGVGPVRPPRRQAAVEVPRRSAGRAASWPRSTSATSPTRCTPDEALAMLKATDADAGPSAKPRCWPTATRRTSRRRAGSAIPTT